MRSVVAAFLSALLLFGLPLAGGVGGAWVAVVYVMPEPEPESTADGERCGMWWMTRVADHLANGLTTGLVGLVGLTAGLATGVAIALPAVRTLSDWSTRHQDIDDERDD
jgi:hypothetical protein